MPKTDHPGNGKTSSHHEDDELRQYQKDCYSALVVNRSNLDDRAFKTSERYDQWVLTLAGGALAISLTFLEKIAPEPARNTLFLLGVSWAAYILAILAAFSAIYYSRKAIGRAIEIADANYNHFMATSSKDKPQGEAPPVLKNRPTKTVDCLNKASLACLVAGTGVMCAFALINLGGAKVAKEDDTSKQTTVIVNLQPGINSITNTAKGTP